MKKYAIIYRRISTNSTKQDIDRQKQPLLNYCKSNNLEILNDFFDEISGTTKAATRTGYNKMKDYIDSIIDNYDALQISIVFDEISRLGRSKVDIINVIDEWSKRNVNIRVVNPALSYYDDAGNIDYNADLILTLFAQMAESEHRTIKERIKSSRLRVIEKGHSLGSVELFGYKNNNKVLEIEKNEAKTVRRIFTLYISGVGAKSIAGILNKEGVKTKKDKKWITTTILAMLRNKQYTGVRLLNGVEYPAKHLQIIDDETFNKAQEILNNKKSDTVNHNKYINPLKGILNCICGSSIYVKKRINKLAYVCNSDNNSDKCNLFTQINYNRMNNIIYTLYDILISETKTNKSYIDKLKQEKKQINDIEIKILDNELKDFNSKRDRIIDSYVEGLLNKEKRDDKLNKLNEQKKNKEDKLKRFKNRVKEIDSQIEKLNNTSNESIIDVNQLKVFAENNIKNITIQRVNELKGFEDLFRSNETIYKINITLITDKKITVFTGNYTPYLITTVSGITLESNQFKKGFIKHIDDKEDVELYHRIINDKMYLILEINKFFENN